MTRRSKTLAAAALGLALTGCVKEARIVLPAGVAATAEPVELAGMGGWDRGTFRIGSSTGRFTRAAYQAESGDGFERRNFGGGSFEVEGPDVDGRLSARCGYEEAENRVGAVSVVAERFAYRCRFRRNGEPIEAGLILEEVPSRPGHLLSGRTRGGEIHIEGRVMEIRAIHDLDGGRVPTMDPLGYAFEATGRAIGAVDLNGGNKTVFAPAGRDRELVVAASLALAILWDGAT